MIEGMTGSGRDDEGYEPPPTDRLPDEVFVQQPRPVEKHKFPATHVSFDFQGATFWNPDEANIRAVFVDEIAKEMKHAIVSVTDIDAMKMQLEAELEHMVAFAPTRKNLLDFVKTEFNVEVDPENFTVDDENLES